MRRKRETKRPPPLVYPASDRAHSPAAGGGMGLSTKLRRYVQSRQWRALVRVLRLCVAQCVKLLLLCWIGVLSLGRLITVCVQRSRRLPPQSPVSPSTHSSLRSGGQSPSSSVDDGLYQSAVAAGGRGGKRRASGMHGRSSSFYYDVEEGEFQPAQRLTFRAHNLANGGDGSSIVILPSPLTKGVRSHPSHHNSTSTSPPSFLLKSAKSPTPSCSPNPTAGGESKEQKNNNNLQPPGPDAKWVDRALAEGYFVGNAGDLVGNGAFQLIAYMGHGTYSSVWLAVDRKGVTSGMMPTLLHRMEDRGGYNSSANILRGNLEHAFVAIKLSRSAPLFVDACEQEFDLNKKLLLELQRSGFSLDRFVLFPSCFVEPAKQSRLNDNSNQQSQEDASSAHRLQRLARPPPLAKASSAAEQAVHFGQVGEVCGPSLLELIELMTTGPHKAVTLQDHLWRLRCVKRMAANILEGLMQLHACGVVHTDLKPENVLAALPAAVYLERMSSQGSASQRRRARDLLFARHRGEILSRHRAWDVLCISSGLTDSGADEDDVLQVLCSIKLADLGTSLRCRAVPLRSSSASTNQSPVSGASSNWGGPSSSASSMCTTPQRGSFSHTPRPSQLWQPRLLQTREYRAPEVLLQLRPESMVAASLDIWSFGCLLFEMATGHYLFHPRAVCAVHPHPLPDGCPPPPGVSIADYREDLAHMGAMEQLLAECAPSELTCGSLYEDYFTPGKVESMVTGGCSTVRNGSAPLHPKQHVLADIVRKACGLVVTAAGVTELRMDGESEEGEKQLEDECRSLASVIAATLEWVPTHRPSAQELLSMDWFASSK